MANRPLQGKGFSLVELMIVLAVSAMLLAAAVPSFSASIQNNRLTTQVNEIHAGLSLARSEAVKRNQDVAMCNSSNGTSCNGSWHDGWLVFVDDNSSGRRDEGEEILRTGGPVQGDVSIVFSQTRVRYASSGLAKHGSKGTFTFCDKRGVSTVKGLYINGSGRPTLSRDSDGNGIPETPRNVDLTCS